MPSQSHSEMPTAADVILSEKYRELARQHRRRLLSFFAKLTGIYSHLVWAPIWPRPWSVRHLPTHSQVCRKVLVACPEVRRGCRDCATRHLALALKAGHKGHLFTCYRGVHNFWLPIIVRGCVVGLAFVQAPALAAGRKFRGRTRLISERATSSKPGRLGALPSWRMSVSDGPPRSMTRSDFRDAARLFQLFLEHIETSVLADLRKSDLKQAQQALVELQTVATRLRTELNGLIPAFNKTGPVLQPDNHPKQTIRAALAWINAGYSHSVTLKGCAEKVGLNPAYLSALFSRSVGVPFKTYLTEVRMEKARELLSDPAKAVADVASAVGYASENRFRIAFKHLTGLSPSLWRETLQMQSNRHVPPRRK